MNMGKLINTLFLISIISALLIAGCSSSTIVKYQCNDGSFADSATLCAGKISQVAQDCPKLDCASCPTNIVEKPVQIIKYQCADESIKDKLTDCPQVLAAKTISPSKEFSGVGDKVTDAFYLNKGFTKVTSHYQGDSNFIVHLIDENGGEQSIHNEIGNYDGEIAVTIRTAGNYRLSVQAQGWSSTGSWNIKLEQ